MSDNLIDNVKKMDQMEKETIQSLGSGFKAFQNRNPNYILVSRNTMGENISFTGSMTLDSFGKNIKFAMQMPLFSQMVTTENGKLKLERDPHMLNELTQREVDYKREADLVRYLLDDQRKFPPVLAVVTADWVDPDSGKYNKDFWGDGQMPVAKQDSCNYIPLTEDLGLLDISSNYFIYALDGQHRLLGVKGLQQLADKGSLTIGKKDRKIDWFKHDDYPVSNIHKILNEKISIEFVVGVKKDETRSEAKERVRTLFVDINDKAQRLSKAAGAALKDNGYNKIAKNVLEKGTNFLSKTVVKDGKTENVTNLQSTNPTDGSPEFTTLDILVNMAEYLIQDDKLNSKSNSKYDKEEEAKQIEEYTSIFSDFIDKMQKLECIDQFLNTTDVKASNFRIYNHKKVSGQHGQGNVLFRRVGQIAFAKSVGLCLKDNKDLNQIFKAIYKFEKKGGFSKLDNWDSIFYSVLYNPQKTRMIVSTSAITLAAKLLKYVLFQNVTDEERESLRQSLIESRLLRTAGKVINYDGNHLECKILEDDTFECDLKLPETV